MKILGTCRHCEDGRFGMTVCPSCWGTTVDPDVLDKMKIKLSCIHEAYEAKRKDNKRLRGQARGVGGQTLSKVGKIERALEAEIQRIEAKVAENKAVARAVGAAASQR